MAELTEKEYDELDEAITKEMPKLKKGVGGLFTLDNKEDPFYSDENQAALHKAIVDYSEGCNFHEHELIDD
jgi:hypothetical protein